MREPDSKNYAEPPPKMVTHRLVALQRCVVSYWMKKVNVLHDLSFCKKSQNSGVVAGQQRAFGEQNPVSPAVCRIPS
jgi:hypothetical protein